jgi:eukaryotic-like serine/threonine-protein kinase
MSDQGPTVFNDRYEMHRRLARGGMSDVYLARDLLLDRPVAVKVLFAEYAKDPTFVERFRREAQAAANLNHPNVVAVYDWGQQSGTYFIVMEYVEGRSLSEIIRTEGPLHPRRAAEITADVAAALGFAHRNGVVHRDIKPGNIMISPSGQVKVADFGIAQAISGGTEANLTQAGAVMGTATYFSPEQAQGRPVDPRSDLYSLGCVLYEMLTTRPPFTGDTPVAIAYKHVQEPAPIPSSTGVAVPPALEAIVAQLLAKDPAQRYASAEDLRADLRNYLEGLPVSALRSQAALAAGLAGAAAAGAAVGALPPAGTQAVPAVGPAGPATGTYAAAAPPPKRRTTFLWVMLGVLVVLAGGLLFLATRLDRNSTVQKPVPDVTTKAVDVARAQLEADGFKVTVVTKANSQVPNGQVFAQLPVGGAQADQGSTVTLDVSKGAGQVPVPPVVGQTQAGATATLEAAGFTVRALPQASDTVVTGQVISQSPSANTPADKGSEVDLTVSSGPSTVPVPDVKGQSASSASANLASAGFKVTTVEQASSVTPAGQVIGTNPSAGISVAPGTTVTIIVSSGPSVSSTSTSTSTTPTTAATTTTA